MRDDRPCGFTISECAKCLLAWSDKVEAAERAHQETQQRVEELSAQIARMATVMKAAAAEIEEHWDAHCDAEGYGPRNLIERLKANHLELGFACYPFYCEMLQHAESRVAEFKTLLDKLLTYLLFKKRMCPPGKVNCSRPEPPEPSECRDCWLDWLYRGDEKEVIESE